MLSHAERKDLDAAAGAAASTSRSLTFAELVWYEGRIERWIRFGCIAEEQIVDRRRRRVGFEPGASFAFVRWQANDVGTVTSKIDILRAVPRGEAHSTVPGVSPGGESLLRLSGWPKVKSALQAIDAVEALGIEAHAASPDHWRQVHNRLAAGRAAEPYSRMRHRAWTLREALAS